MSQLDEDWQAIWDSHEAQRVETNELRIRVEILEETLAIHQEEREQLEATVRSLTAMLFEAENQ